MQLELENKLLGSIPEKDLHGYKDPETARLTIHGNKVLNSHLVPGLVVDVKELADGIDIKMDLKDNTIIKKPVHLCFGVIPEKGIQKILLNIVIGKNSKISLNAHCTFPFAIDVQHIMKAKIHLKKNSEYEYFERHIHSQSGGVEVLPQAIVIIEENAKFKTEFELIKGRVGKMDINYTGYIKKHGLMDMTARISASHNDKIKLSEIAYLEEEYAKAVLTSKIAVRNESTAEIYNKIVAKAPFCRGHVDCKEIVKDNGHAIAIPIVDVQNAQAHVTHEAAVGSVDKKQLQTLMTRGLDEDEASEIIIQGLLS